MTKRTTRKPAQKKSSPRRGVKKPKVSLDTNKVAVVSVFICAMCVLILAVSAFFSAKKKPEQSKPNVEEVVQQENEKPVAKKPEQKKPKQEKPKPETPNPPKTEEPKNESATLPPKREEETPIVQPPKEETPPVVEVPPADFGFPKAANNAVLCIVFDDGGQNIAQLKKCIALPFPVTVAVMPRLAHSAESAALVRQSGNEVILHQPMQAINLNVNPGAGAILPDMTGNEIAATLAQNIAEIAPIAGVNNHEGSLITEDEVRMGFVLETLNQRGIYFLDSRTSSATKVPSVSMEMGYSYYQRDIFLDNQKTRENILNELKRGLAVANEQGYVIMIGHVWSAEILPAVLAEVYPELKQKGYRFSVVSKSGAEHK